MLPISAPLSAAPQFPSILTSWHDWKLGFWLRLRNKYRIHLHSGTVEDNLEINNIIQTGIRLQPCTPESPPRSVGGTLVWPTGRCLLSIVGHHGLNLGPSDLCEIEELLSQHGHKCSAAVMQVFWQIAYSKQISPSLGSVWFPTSGVPGSHTHTHTFGAT